MNEANQAAHRQSTYMKLNGIAQHGFLSLPTFVYPFSRDCTYSNDAYCFKREGNPLSCCKRASSACRIFRGATDSHGFSLSSSIFSQILLSSDQTPFRSWSSSSAMVTRSSLPDTKPWGERGEEGGEGRKEGKGGGEGGEGEKGGGG